MRARVTGSTGTGCDSSTVVSNPAILCREIHIEPFTTNGVPMLQAWVRVVRGGTTDFHVGSVLMQETFSQ